LIKHDAGQRCPPIFMPLAWRCLFFVVLLAFGLVAAAEGAQPSPARGKTRVVVLSDFNDSYGSVRYSHHVDDAVTRTIELMPDLVISTGDMVAGQRLSPLLERGEVEAMWSAFHQRVSDRLARAGLPFAVTPGNHDASSGNRFQVERQVYRQQWLPRRPALQFVDADSYPFRYAFALRDVLFISLDATRVGHLSGADKDWLRLLLVREGPRFRHRVVFGHLPLWPFTEGRETEILGDTELEAILRDGRVDLHLSGHHHAYYPGFKDGVRYVSQACLGAGPRTLLGAGGRSTRSVTVIDFDESGAIRVDALGGPDYLQPVARSTLPPRIESRWGTIVRDDLAPVSAGSAAR